MDTITLRQNGMKPRQMKSRFKRCNRRDDTETDQNHIYTCVQPCPSLLTATSSVLLLSVCQKYEQRILNQMLFLSKRVGRKFSRKQLLAQYLWTSKSCSCHL